MNTGNAAETTRVLSRALTGFEELGERWGRPGTRLPEPGEEAPTWGSLANGLQKVMT